MPSPNRNDRTHLFVQNDGWNKDGLGRVKGSMIMFKLATTDVRAEDILEKLERLRTELVDMAFDLERGGRLDAADIAISTSTRVGELCSEFSDRS